MSDLVWALKSIYDNRIWTLKSREDAERVRLTMCRPSDFEVVRVAVVRDTDSAKGEDE